MAERLNLTNPIIRPTIISYRISSILLDWDSLGDDSGPGTIYIKIVGSDGSSLEFRYDGVIAHNLMSTLNNANLSTKSLQRRILEKLSLDNNNLKGNITGTPL